MNGDINERVELALVEEPQTTAEKGSLKILEEQQDALAQAYAIHGWRDYMNNLINLTIRSAITNFKDIEELRLEQGKVLALKELLSRSRKAYEEFSKKK